MTVLLILSGPIVRRVHAPSRSFCVAVSHPATVTRDDSSAIFDAAGRRMRLMESSG
jgi:hypothetical protein